MKLRFYKVTALPQTPEPNALYYVLDGARVDQYITDQAGESYPVGNHALLADALGGLVLPDAETVDLVEGFSLVNGELRYLGEPVLRQSYTYNFNNSSAWSVPHNLGYYPEVLVLDEDGHEVYGDVQHGSTDHVLITFTRSLTGKVILS